APAEAKFLIVGYADKATGSAAGNEILSRKRAESVRECLVNEFGVPLSRLDVSWKGGVGNMFYDDPALSRVVIITPKDK
ncbi:OmpA family protein, partial [uncultured Duncaniella sp.]